MKPMTIATAALAAMLAGGVAGAFAHGGATGVVKERMESMEALGDAMKELTAMMRGQRPYGAERVRALAGIIESHGGDALTELFPKGSLDHPSEAVPAIWSNLDRFSAIADRLSEYAAALAKAAGNDRPAAGAGGMMQGQGMMGTGHGPTAEMLVRMPPDAVFLHLADTCSACHQDFRKKQN